MFSILLSNLSYTIHVVRYLNIQMRIYIFLESRNDHEYLWSRIEPPKPRPRVYIT